MSVSEQYEIGAKPFADTVEDSIQTIFHDIAAELGYFTTCLEKLKKNQTDEIGRATFSSVIERFDRNLRLYFPNGETTNLHNLCTELPSEIIRFLPNQLMSVRYSLGEIEKL
jgi:hypothetical protein